MHDIDSYEIEELELEEIVLCSSLDICTSRCYEEELPYFLIDNQAD